VTDTKAAAPDRATISVDASRDGQVVTILVDRQTKLNALTLDMLAELAAVLDDVAASTARVVVVRTGGQRVFCVGADIAAFSRLAPAEMWRRWIACGHRVFDRLARLPQPTVAVVDGLALGGGLELALACDFRVAADSARFGLPEVGLGTIPGWGGTERLTRLVGASRAKELIMARRQIDAATALSWGLLTSVASGELEPDVERLVNDLLGAAPIAQQVAKQLVDAAAVGAPSATLEAIASGFTAATADYAEGVSAFFAKSSPRFTGR
jgi:enoyl-CoA hydratase